MAKFTRTPVDGGSTPAGEEYGRLKAHLLALEAEDAHKLLPREIELERAHVVPMRPSAAPQHEKLVAELLNGFAPMVVANDPAVELHNLIERRGAIKEAIRIGQQRLTVLKGEIDRAVLLNGGGSQFRAVLREKVLIAVRLQRLNVQLEELRQRYGGMPSDDVYARGMAHRQLGLPTVGDQVYQLVQSALACGFISKRELDDNA
jgi:hypothetical protein